MELMNYDNNMPDPLDIIDGAVIRQVFCQGCALDITANDTVSGHCAVRKSDKRPVLLLVCPVCGYYNEVEIDIEEGGGQKFS